MVKAFWQGSGEDVAIISGALSDDTPACNKHRDFLAAGTLVCGGADSNWCPSVLGSGMAGQQFPSEVGSYPHAPFLSQLTYGPWLWFHLRLEKQCKS